jgi:glycyl-tRNA synthetase
MHSNATTTKLVVRQPLEQPIVKEVWEPILDRKKLGPKFKGDAKALEAHIVGLSQLEIEECKKTLEEKGSVAFNLEGRDHPLIVDKELMQVERVTKKETSNRL